MLNHAISYLLFHALRYFLVVWFSVFFNTARIARELYQTIKCASDENNTNRIIQTPSNVSEFDRDQKIVALLTEMLKFKCKDINKSKFGSFGLPILLLCSVPSVFALFQTGQTGTLQSITGSYFARSVDQIW